MYLTPTNKHWACDIEADELLDKATCIWCVCVENVETGEKYAFTDREAFSLWLGRLTPDYRLVGHNFIAYDLPMLNRHWGTAIGISHVVDTFVLSQLYNPSYAGGHSLEAWGTRLGHPKTNHEDFSCLTPEMLEYCENDTCLTALLFRRLTSRMRQYSFTESGAEIEHLSWNIIQNKQRRNGFPFDYERAHKLYVTLRAREEELRKEIHGLWPPKLIPVREYQRPYRADGDRSANFTKHLGQYPKIEVAPDRSYYTAYDWVVFNLGSPKQRVGKLLELGWQPTQFTKRTVKGGGGNPKVDEDSLTAFAELSGRPEIKSLAKWIVINSRANMVATWMDAYRPDTKAIHGRLFIASTLRYRHSHPNSANIPAVRTKKDENEEDQILYGEDGFWTYESRDLWTSGDSGDYTLVGIDGTGIQTRCLIHHLIGTVGEERVADFKELALRGDIHKHNITVLGLANKAAAKKFYYCVPLDARALTKTGWKGYDEVEVGELVLSYNKDKRIQEWTPVLEKVYFDDAPVIEMGNSRFKMRSTPNHRWFVQQRKGSIKNSNRDIEVRTTEELTTMQNIIVNAPLSDEGSDDFNWMKLPKYGTDWEAAVLKMSQKERRAFLAGFCIADGYIDGNGDWRWSQLRGPLYEAALLASYLVHDGVVTSFTSKRSNGKDMATVGLSKKPHVTTASFEFKKLENQPVWCIRTANETWVMRQGDNITITGNTLMMGGQGKRLAADQAQFGTKMTPAEGAALKDRMIASMPGFGELIKCLTETLNKKGRITLCDGTPILVPLPHMVIPYLLQGDESRLMKKAMILVDQEVSRQRLRDHVFKVVDVHDEWQFRVRNKYVEQFIRLALPCFPRAGESFGYNILIEGGAKKGLTWAETH